MNTFEAVTLGVTAASTALAFTPYLRPSRVLDQLGRQGKVWFEHVDDLALDQRPSEDDRDAPLPRRPLRGSPH
jgi:hypothetical protein